MDDLTAEEFARLVPTDLGSVDLATLIASAYQAIDAVAGAAGEVVEVRDGGSSVIILARRAAVPTYYDSPITIREAGDDFDLADDDWFLRPDRRSLDRLATGTNPRTRWHGPVLVRYEPLDESAIRKAVAIKLVQLDIAMTPGVLGFTEGNWSIQFPNGESWGATREEILAQSHAPLWHFG